MPVTLILGGARSGKSRRAEQIARALDAQPLYIATAPHIPDDAEWQARIARHRRDRGDDWLLIEEELELAEALQKHAHAGRAIVVDCLTLWLSNLLHAEQEPAVATAALCDLLPGLLGHIVLVSNEVGMGLVPEGGVGRAFRDAQGRLNQAVAAVADRVEFVAAGLPLQLK